MRCGHALPQSVRVFAAHERGQMTGCCVFTLGDELYIDEVHTFGGPDAQLVDGLVRAVLQYALIRSVRQAVFRVPGPQRDLLEQMGFLPPEHCDIEAFFSQHRNCEKNIE